MTERDNLLASIVNLVRDYRSGEIPEPTPSHIDRWVHQFDEEVQVPMLRELSHVFKRTYVSKTKTQQLLRKIVARFPCEFWKKAHILDIQKQGSSQAEMRDMLEPIIKEKCGPKVNSQIDKTQTYIYLDDAIFTGDRIIDDLSEWMGTGPEKAKVHIFVIALHKYGRYRILNDNEQLNELKSQKDIEIRIGRFEDYVFENRRTYRNQSDVLWPVSEVYEDEWFRPRKPNVAQSRIFSTEQGRQLLEREFLNAGLKIQGFAKNPSHQLKPLGYSPFDPGFGSLFVTFRNCPNNSPLALWYGDPSSYPDTHPLGMWYPLFPRKGYSQ